MADSDETPTFIEGDEEVQYLFVSLPSNLDPVAFGPGSTVTLEGLATEQPVLRSVPVNAQGAAQAAGGQAGSKAAGSTALQGTYVDNMGSILLVKEQPAASHNAKPVFDYLGHTNKQLKFTKPS